MLRTEGRRAHEGGGDRPERGRRNLRRSFPEQLGRQFRIQHSLGRELVDARDASAVGRLQHMSADIGDAL